VLGIAPGFKEPLQFRAALLLTLEKKVGGEIRISGADSDRAPIL
jgi:hypothetical protein